MNGARENGYTDNEIWEFLTSIEPRLNRFIISDIPLDVAIEAIQLSAFRFKSFLDKWNPKSDERAIAEMNYNFGVFFEQGEGVPKNEKEAVKWFRLAAEQGHEGAQFDLGVCYADGKGVSKDEAEAIKWYRKAADNDHSEAQFTLGSLYLNGRIVEQNTQEGMSLLRQSAEQGNLKAQKSLAFLHRELSYIIGANSNIFGPGSDKLSGQNKLESIKWYRKAAEQGDAEAQFNLGVRYANGDGVTKDQSEAVMWYRKAAEQGNAEAQFNLGVCYANGDGVTKDQSEAVIWYRKAAEQGDAKAQFYLGGRYFNGDGVTKDQSEALMWYRKAAEQGDAEAQFNLGVCYENGYGVTKDQSQAVMWYRKAAEQSNSKGQLVLGLRYYNGEGIAKNPTEAIKWFRMAAELGNADAQNNLGICYITGEGVQKNQDEAVKWFKKAAEQGQKNAETLLKKLLDKPKPIKLALLIANSNYPQLGGLENPISDAQQLEQTLKGIGFHVKVLRNGSKEEMIDAIKVFEQQIKETGALAFFHYGGHGIQVNGKNFLIPANVDIPDETRVSTRALDLDEVMTALDAANPHASIVVIDACRDNPLPFLASRSGTRGLAVVGRKPKNSIVIFSAEAGSKAIDGLFTPAFVSALKIKNISIEKVMKLVRNEVNKKSNGLQIPGEYNQLFEEIYLSNNSDFKVDFDISLENNKNHNNKNELLKDKFSKNIIKEFSSILDSTSGFTNGPQKMKAPFSFKWGESFQNVEKSILNLSKTTEAKIIGIEYISDSKILAVEKIPQKSLDRSLFLFDNDRLRAIQLSYSDINWSKDRYSTFYEEVKNNLNSKYGEGMPLSMQTKFIDNMTITYNGIQYADKAMGIGLFLFTATENGQVFQSLVLRYNSK
jgi:TPR repeat protein